VRLESTLKVFRTNEVDNLIQDKKGTTMPRTNARDVVLGLIRKAPKGIWKGKTKLFKAFYFAHLYYAKNYPGILTNWPIARMPEGPGIDNASKLFDALVQERYLKVERVEEGPYPEFCYRITEKGRKSLIPPKEAQEAIDLAASFTLPKTAAELSQITHEHSRSWNSGSNGQRLDIYIDLIPDDEFEKGKAEIAELADKLSAILKKRKSRPVKAS
jgi:hypothetical protein